ncbi:MAG TPA: nucleotidyltransferase domain-containing protein [Bryobacteraceae bacterium]|jgi:predicted nucleotidyltransferase|nr:nucleotidyltransferase domain-containing protein [Bryobacteraceae bacterium]
MVPGSPDLEEVRRIVLRFLKGRQAHVYLFGSWARGEACRVSDIDVAILPSEPLPAGLLPEIEEALENSRSLYPVDLVDLTTTSDNFRRRVLAEGLSWTA